MLTTLVPCTVVQEECGAILTMTSFTGAAQITQGPVQKLESFLGIPGFVTGVKSQTLVPGRKVFFSLWYCLLCRWTAPWRFFRTYSWQVSMRWRSCRMYSGPVCRLLSPPRLGLPNSTSKGVETSLPKRIWYGASPVERQMVVRMAKRA